MFVHQTDLRAGTDITEGDTVEFGTADYKGREKAVDVIKVDPAPTHRRQGVCQWFDPERKKGFITPDGGGADVFVHQTGLRSGTEITAGDRVEFGTVDYVDGERRRRRPKAVGVIKVGPAAVIAPARPLVDAAESAPAKNAPKGPSLAELAGRAARDARSPRSRSRSPRRSRRRSSSRSGSRSRLGGRRRRDRPPRARRHRGVYRDAKGHERKRYGFITAGFGPTDVFMHLDDVREGHIVRDGDSVEYTLVPCRRTGKDRAVDVVKLTSWVPDGTVAARTNEMLAGDHSIKAQFDEGTLTVRTLCAAVAESLGLEEADVKKVVKETLMAALEAPKARSPQPPPSEVSDDSGAAAPRW